MNTEVALAYLLTSPATWSLLAYNINSTMVFRVKTRVLATAVGMLTGRRVASMVIGRYLNNEAWLNRLGLSLVERRRGFNRGGIYVIMIIDRNRAIRVNAIYARRLGLTSQQAGKHTPQ
jgi:hypothetical protein